LSPGSGVVGAKPRNAVFTLFRPPPPRLVNELAARDAISLPKDSELLKADLGAL
jgi:hypothetical protein